MTQNSDKPQSQNLLQTTLLGFLSIVFLVLAMALIIRLVYPKIKTERTASTTHLIGNIIQLQVLNGNGTPGLATTFSNKLRESGFDVVETGNFETFDVEKTHIIDRIGNIENARRVARALGVADQQIIREISIGYYLDVTVVIGADYPELNLQ
jgi:hypothetical protein